MTTNEHKSRSRSNNNVKMDDFLDTPIEYGNINALITSPALSGSRLFNAIEPKKGAIQELIGISFLR